jgi:hypothetical protein
LVGSSERIATSQFSVGRRDAAAAMSIEFDPEYVTVRARGPWRDSELGSYFLICTSCRNERHNLALAVGQ